MFELCWIWLSIFAFANAQNCKPSVTTVSGSAASERVCSGELIFSENFDTLDKNRWQHEETLGGGGNTEFQWYTSDTKNSFVKNGKLHLKPSLTSTKIGLGGVDHGYVHLDACTDQNKENCKRQAGGDVIINPILSARINTKHSFSFKYGRVEVLAKIPTGDWLWPAIWLMPTQSKYGEWPRSGEIDLLEARGNLKLVDHWGNSIGTQQISSTLHFGPRWDFNAFYTASYTRNNVAGYNNDFHKYELVWNERGIRFLVDGNEIGFVDVGKGFWERSGFYGQDIWSSGTNMAPFDEQFHLIINLAVGGKNGFFPDLYNQYKPWKNYSPTAMKDFWTNRSHWLSTWDIFGDRSSLIVDYVKVWAI